MRWADPTEADPGSAASWQRRFTKVGLSFDDVLLVPGYAEVLPDQVDVRSNVTRGVQLSVPILSAAMDTVTEARLAIALAQEGGMGVIHRNMSVQAQADEVDKVKRSESGMIVDPITLPPTARVAEALDLMARFRISGVPITQADGKLVGILTNRDLRFVRDVQQPVSAYMTAEELVTVPEGTTLEEAQEHLHKHRIEKLLVVDEGFHLRGLITVKDIQKKVKYPNAAKDEKGRPVRFGSVGGGGRYDGLVGRFRPEQIPATGFSIGVSRLQAALTLLGKLGDGVERGPVVVTVFDRDRIADYQRMVKRLRDANIRAELYLGNPKNFSNQLKYADRRNSPCVVIQGGDEK
ncbi:MAG: IMP dehydrogenase, partial [Armatimonadetes bacterium]|nr:IMP dehydrogenase [Armatimonadota bacterium]